MKNEKLNKLNIGCMAILSGIDYMIAQGYTEEYLNQAIKNVRIACTKRDITVEKLSEEIDSKL